MKEPVLGLDKRQICSLIQGHGPVHASSQGWAWREDAETAGAGWPNLGSGPTPNFDESPVTPQQKQEKILRKTWDDLNAEEANKVVPKAIEYGSGDLKLMGYAMKQLLNSPRARAHDWTEPESMEIAIAFYILGKIARMLSAYERGAMPADDQPHDIGVYTRMVQVLRRTGEWPPGFEEYLKGVE